MTIRFGGSTPGTATAGGFACGVPGPAALGGLTSAPADTAAAATYRQLAEQSYQRLQVGRGGGDVRAICIAPDSAIACCDIAIMGRDGERDRHRISAGNPYLGCLSSDDTEIYVSIPNSIPKLTQDPGGDDPDAFWDAVPVGSFDGIVFHGVPLRLELWRGDVLPIRANERAPLVAHGIFFVDSAAARSFTVCVDGRRRVDIQAVTDSNELVTITASAQEAQKNPAAANVRDSPFSRALELDDAGATSATFSFQAGTDSGTRIYSFYGNPMTLLRVDLTGVSVSSTQAVQLRVLAWDK